MSNPASSQHSRFDRFSNPPGLYLVALACLVPACGESTGPQACTATSVGPITVGSGLTPTISWAASCPAIALAVFSPVTGLPTWELEADTKQIPKPVTYGVVPSGVIEVHAAVALQPGAQYNVLVRLVTTHGDTLGEIDTFTP